MSQLSCYIRDYLEALDTPHSLAIWLLYESGEHKQLLDLSLNPLDFEDAAVFRRSFLASSLLSKCDFLSAYSADDRRRRALDKFDECEAKCKLTNSLILSRSWGKDLPEFDALLLGMRRQIDFVLEGTELHPHTFTCEEIAESGGWGPGSSVLVSKDTSDVNKFRYDGGATRACFELFGGLFQAAYPLWVVPWCIVPGNKVTTVKKSSKIDRTIAIEPGINLWIQKAIGRMISRRLRRYSGIDIKNQSEKNIEFSRLGSIRNDLSTVDFSSASDTISKNLVRELLPSRWLAILEASRSSHMVRDGSIVLSEKFSSMGNGFTFELETLLFHSAAVSVCRFLGLDFNPQVFGDDVIIPTPAYELYCSFMTHLGFTVNSKKSYSSSYFRESCGGYWFNGTDLKPYYLRSKPSGPLWYFKFANAVSRIARFHWWRDARFEPLWDRLFSDCKLKYLVPLRLGDCGFAVPLERACPPRQRHFVEGYFATCLITQVLPRSDDSINLLLSRLSRPSSDRAYGNLYSVRNCVKLVKRTIRVPDWDYLGPWL
jgi:hypothetical protein